METHNYCFVMSFLKKVEDAVTVTSYKIQMGGNDIPDLICICMDFVFIFLNVPGTFIYLKFFLNYNVQICSRITPILMYMYQWWNIDGASISIHVPESTHKLRLVISMDGHYTHIFLCRSSIDIKYWWGKPKYSWSDVPLIHPGLLKFLCQFVCQFVPDF